MIVWQVHMPGQIDQPYIESYTGNIAVVTLTHAVKFTVVKSSADGHDTTQKAYFYYMDSGEGLLDAMQAALNEAKSWYHKANSYKRDKQMTYQEAGEEYGDGAE